MICNRAKFYQAESSEKYFFPIERPKQKIGREYEYMKCIFKNVRLSWAFSFLFCCFILFVFSYTDHIMGKVNHLKYAWNSIWVCTFLSSPSSHDDVRMHGMCGMWTRDFPFKMRHIFILSFIFLFFCYLFMFARNVEWTRVLSMLWLTL